MFWPPWPCARPGAVAAWSLGGGKCVPRLDTARTYEIETPSPGLDPGRYVSYEAGVKARYDDLVDQVRSVALEVPGILGTEKCFVRKAGMRYHLDLHARMDGEISVREGHEIAHRLKDHLSDQIPGLGNILIHIEPCEAPEEK